MAGHSKWANTKHRKAAQDAKRGKVFTKLIRELTVAARQGGGDPDANPRLRAAVDKALGANMTKDTVQRAIDRGAGDTENDNVEELTYEGYGPEGVAILVECMTDNRNRTASDVRHAFSKFGGNLGTANSVAFLFSQQGRIGFASDSDEEQLLELALEAGAEDVEEGDSGERIVVTSPAAFGAVRDAFDTAGLEPEFSEVGKYPANYAPITDVELATRVVKLIDWLEELDDVQNVYTNADFSDDVLEALA
ncbi:Transcriptional regulatory protein PmpR [Carnimonas sp. R-84981]|uniref:YebC/PmpR family DNA-binding transcriptional regulator n=1 Tax=Carnimonas bestiolae TaxID=3402172 RepID=UPI003EDC600F